MPIEKDAILGPNFLVGLAQIEAHTGQSEDAVKHLRQLLTIPAGEYISVARLKIDPVWDPIRNDPGFQKLLSGPEPETVYSSKLKRCVDVISDALPFGRLWYDGPNAASNAIGYASQYSRSHGAVIRVYDDAGNRDRDAQESTRAGSKSGERVKTKSRHAGEA